MTRCQSSCREGSGVSPLGESNADSEQRVLVSRQTTTQTNIESTAMQKCSACSNCTALAQQRCCSPTTSSITSQQTTQARKQQLEECCCPDPGHTVGGDSLPGACPCPATREPCALPISCSIRRAWQPAHRLPCWCAGVPHLLVCAQAAAAGFEGRPLRFGCRRRPDLRCWDRGTMRKIHILVQVDDHPFFAAANCCCTISCWGPRTSTRTTATSCSSTHCCSLHWS